jgi:hypothetical protein
MGMHEMSVLERGPSRGDYVRPFVLAPPDSGLVVGEPEGFHAWRVRGELRRFD